MSFSLSLHIFAAGPDKVDVNEVLEMDKDLRSQVGEGEIHGVILLYLVKEDRNQRRYNKELESKFEKDERIVNGMFFPLQVRCENF
jgi:Ubiquitin carboxyl-terminal hydrolase, family 1